MTLKGLAASAAPVAVGVLAIGLAFFYLGDKPLIKEAQKGFNGDNSGDWF